MSIVRRSLYYSPDFDSLSWHKYVDLRFAWQLIALARMRWVLCAELSRNVRMSYIGNIYRIAWNSIAVYLPLRIVNCSALRLFLHTVWGETEGKWELGLPSLLRCCVSSAHKRMATKDIDRPWHTKHTFSLRAAKNARLMKVKQLCRINLSLLHEKFKFE